MGKAYPKIEKFFIYNSIAILLLLTVLQGSYSLRRVLLIARIDAFNLFTLFALIIQFSFLILIFRITWLRDSLKSTAMENQSLAAYSSGLEKNMDDIKSIKHDIKNIFLTMGSFVEQSDHTEMKTYYREKISPFAADEIMKSDLYGKLVAIDNEQLKAFLFYKISQAIERGIALDLDIAPNFSVSDSKIEFTDLIRVLGILLDNAVEECMELDNSLLIIKISQNDEMSSYMIKNTIRHEIKEKGIKVGVSTKGSERGKGLVIGRSILEKYDFVTLNSYFQNDCFVQNLVIYCDSE
jgi:sensor histidine kinase regulating citrate/malate metabolism